MAEGAERFRGLWEDEMFARQHVTTDRCAYCEQTLICLIAGWAVRCTRSHSPPLGDWRECGKRADREDRLRIASASNLKSRTALYR